jgi:thiamine pyrophosphate-dependent acetolactate synthase large subunit-like protein
MEGPAPVNVAEGIGRALAETGVEHFFGLVGSGNFSVTSSLVASGAQFVASRHECSAVSMADGYARVSGRPGVATVHQGPGLTNAMTGLTEAAKARTPLLVLAADTSAEAVRSNFRIDQAGLVAAVGAVAERIHSPESAMADLTRAWRTAQTQRRSVVLNMPLDVQAGELPSDPRIDPWPETHPPAASPSSVGEAADVVQAARRPVIVAGRGAVVAGARRELEALAERIGALLATSANGNGLFAGSPWCIGISGGFATPAAATLLRDADVLLSFGASLNMWTTRHGSLIDAETTIVQIDTDSDAIGAHLRADVAVVGDARQAATALDEELASRGHREDGFRGPDIAGQIAAGSWRNQPFEDGTSSTAIDPRVLSLWLDDALPKERTVAIDSGHFMGWPAMYLGVPDAAGFVFTQAYQSIGLGLSSGIGASVARPDRLTAICVGDGGALMAAGEFETLARLGLQAVVVVYNDAAYGAEVHHFGPHGAPLDTVRFPPTDFAALGRAVGLDGVTVRKTDDLKQIGDWIEGHGRPLVVDAKVTPDVVAEWLEEAFRSH